MLGFIIGAFGLFSSKYQVIDIGGQLVKGLTRNLPKVIQNVIEIAGWVQKVLDLGATELWPVAINQTGA